MLFLADALDYLIVVVFIAGFATQIAWPVLCDKPTFPMFRRKRAQPAPVVSIHEPETKETDDELR